MTNLQDLQQSQQTLHEADDVAWADEMAALLRQGRFDELDMEMLLIKQVQKRV